MTTTATSSATIDERQELLSSLAKHRYFLRLTTRGLTDEQVRTRSTVSELCLGGLIKHLTWAERQWANFILQGPSAMGSEHDQGAAVAEFQQGFRVEEGETLAGLLERY